MTLGLRCLHTKKRKHYFLNKVLNALKHETLVLQSIFQAQPTYQLSCFLTTIKTKYKIHLPQPIRQTFLLFKCSILSMYKVLLKQLPPAKCQPKRNFCSDSSHSTCFKLNNRLSSNNNNPLCT